MWPFKKNKTPFFLSGFDLEEKHSAPLHDAPGISKDLQTSTGGLNWLDAKKKLQQNAAPQKLAGHKPNAANLVLRDMLLTFPELANGQYKDLWFTGSRVWHHVYGELVQQSSDTDIYCESYATYCRVLGEYGWWGCPAEDKNWDRSVGGNADLIAKTTGKKIKTPGHGVIDIWYPLGTMSVTDMIKGYPDASHSQAKCAFNFHQGLIILPNINANF